jgi:formylglycine-generating enzyme required for sulfatase activity
MIQFWRVDSGEILRALTVPEGRPSSLAFSPDGETLVASSSAGIYHWRVSDGKLLQDFGDSPGDRVVFSPNGVYIVCGCDGKLEIWDVMSGRLVKIYELGRYGIPGIVFSPDDQLLVSSLADGAARSWVTSTFTAVVASTIDISTSVAIADELELTSIPSLIPPKTAMPQAISTPTKIPPTNTAIPTNTHTPLPSATPLPTQTPTSANQPINLETNPIDGAEIVFVPAGEFIMGSNPNVDPYFWGAEGPQHEVYLDEYWIYRTEVTNSMYQACVAEQACPRPQQLHAIMTDEYYENPTYGDHPVIYVTYIAATAYCRWAGGRLPTEAEWEKAARGTDGRLFPWGDNQPNEKLANLCDRSCAKGVERDNHLDDGYPGPAPVGTFPAGASPYGVLDMSGNVWEWTFDWFQSAYYSVSPGENPRGPSSGSTRAMRGGSWFNSTSGIRTVNRISLSPNKSLNTLGFRCAVDQP